MPHALYYDIGKCHMAKGVGAATADVTWGKAALRQPKHDRDELAGVTAPF